MDDNARSFNSLFPVLLTDSEVRDEIVYYSWIEQRIDPATGQYVDAFSPRRGEKDTGPFLVEINNASVSLPSIQWARFRSIDNKNRPSYEFSAGGTPTPTYYVRLTGSGTGADGGTAWAGRIQKEVAGAVVDGDWIGADGTDYIMFATKAVNGLTGNPEVDDIVDAKPDPLQAGRWLFQPKLFSESRDCSGTSFIKSFRVGNDKCLESKVLGGFGDCECVDAEDEFFPHLWDNTLGGFARAKMLATCCGCGIFVVTPDPDGGEVTAAIKGVHITCETGSGVTKIVDIPLSLDCAGREVDEETNEVYDYVIFTGWGPKSCPESGQDCLNYYRIKVRCGTTCIQPLCDCNCPEMDVTPYAWKFLNAGFPDEYAKYNGWWSARYAGVNSVGRIYWEDGCDPNSVTVRIEYIEADGVYRLTFGEFIYELDASLWNSNGDNTFAWVSGPDPGDQDEITISPLGSQTRECGQDQWPEVLYATVLDWSFSGPGTAVNPFPLDTPIELTRVPITPPEDWTPQAGWQSIYYTNPAPFGSSSSRIVYSCQGGELGCPAVSTDNGWGAGASIGGTTEQCSCDPVYFLGAGSFECIEISGCNAQDFGVTVDWEVEVSE